ncbi:MAG: dihydrofolate reductase family protein [Candidatus Hydrogenedentes bacterium]|nr:dihydrofolate reductase family protein [Candidatus Hydrogenedentota bacterium]
MRNLFLHFAITLDGMVSNVEQWVSISDEAMRDGSAYHDTMDAIIFGNNNYAPLAAYWQQAETAATSAAERAFAKQINDMQKFVLSHGAVELVWKNSELLRAEDSEAFKQAIARLKQMPGKDITVDSGEGAWRSFLEHDLWDGLDMLVHPVVMGHGKPLLASMPIQACLRLVASKTYDDGMMNLRYMKQEEKQ